MTEIADIPVKAADGSTTDLSDQAGNVMLIVNVASKCGFTPQYEGLETLQKQYGDKGFTVLGFPCNQFGAQEPGDAEEIANFCKLTYDVDFPIFAKIDVNGDEAAPIYKYLKSEALGLLGSKAIKWNFTKFLVDRSGRVVKRYAPQTKPEELASARATATRCCSPPDSFDGRWSRRSDSPSLVSSSSARSRPAPGSAPWISCGSSTFSSALKSGSRWWN